MRRFHMLTSLRIITLETIDVNFVKNRPLPLSPFVTKFAYYRLLMATIANGLPREKQNTSVKKEEFESLSLRHLQISCGSIHKTNLIFVGVRFIKPRTFDDLIEILSIVKV